MQVNNHFLSLKIRLILIAIKYNGINHTVLPMKIIELLFRNLLVTTSFVSAVQPTSSLLSSQSSSPSHFQSLLMHLLTHLNSFFPHLRPKDKRSEPNFDCCKLAVIQISCVGNIKKQALIQIKTASVFRTLPSFMENKI